MLSPLDIEKLEMSTICADCKWGIFYRKENDGLIVRMESPLCGHMSSIRGRNFVTGEFIFIQCDELNKEGNCPIFEPKEHPDMQNILSHDGLDFSGVPDGGVLDGQDDDDDDDEDEK